MSSPAAVVTSPLLPSPTWYLTLFPPPNPSPPSKVASSDVYDLGIAVRVAILLLLILVFFIWMKKLLTRRRTPSKDDLATLEDGTRACERSKTVFSFDELSKASGGFAESNILGKGGFGCVYKGSLPGGEKVAIKMLKQGSSQGEREFEAEVAAITRAHHRNLISLVGFCNSSPHRMLVYEFIPNDTLEHHLHVHQNTLGWDCRVKVAVGSARGLSYLHEHCQPMIVHRDIKSANILLGNNFLPKIADFGLARFISDGDTHLSTRVMGSFGYMAPEYALTGQLTDKSDVFSFGVVLLELITGRHPIGDAQFADANIIDWANPIMNVALEDGNFINLADPRLEGNYNLEEMSRMVGCAAACVRPLTRRRPSMIEVTKVLEGCLPLKALDEDGKAAHSKSHESLEFDSGQCKEQLEKFRKMVFTSDLDLED